MAKHHKKAQESQTNLQELGVVTFTEDFEVARDYEILLKNNDIPAMIKEQHESTDDRGFAVMVPEDYLDEAHVIIESQDAYDDFYDSTLEDQDEDDFDSDLFDDGF
ncbi:MAG: hypothetical protein ACYS1A_10095 [Planctomycetota bacterium]|jgi:hypothetical protein